MKKNYFKLLAFLFITAVVACSDDLGNSSVPSVNKINFTLTSTNSTDSIYTTNGSEFWLHGIDVREKATGELISSALFTRSDSLLLNGEEVLGKVTYKNGKVDAIEIVNTCTIKKSNFKDSYLIQRLPEASSDYYIDLGINDNKSGITVRISF
ncbi:MAG: hypothetical protein IJ159_04150 [Prevotella sp.]|nr:hypothetical protein [Prevotella sp.]